MQIYHYENYTTFQNAVGKNYLHIDTELDEHEDGFEKYVCEKP